MIKQIFIGLALLPCLAIGKVDELSMSRDNNGNIRIIDANYECSYGSVEGIKESNEKLGGARIYTEKMGDNETHFIVSLPGGVSINPPVAKKAEHAKDFVTYQSNDATGNTFVVGVSVETGVFSAISVKNNLLHADTIVYDCKVIRNLEHPPLVD